MKCSDCCFFWEAYDEDWPSCHWEPRAPGDIPPCEYDEYEEDE